MILPLAPLKSVVVFCGVLICIGFSQFATSQPVTLRGFITDASSGQPLQGANVVLQSEGDAFLGAVSSVEGIYQIGQIEPGLYVFQVSFIGFTTYTDTLQLGNNLFLVKSVSLEPSPEELDDIVIEVEGGAASVEAGLQTIRPADIERLPTPDASGDLATYLQSLPGVVSMGDRGGQLFIRGGTPSQNLVLMDGLVVYQPFHIIGFFSAFPEDIVSNADLYAGGFGAEYSGRISSVIDIKTRDGNIQKNQASASLSPFLASVRVDGPIKKGNSSFLASVRSSLIKQTGPTLVGEPLPFEFGDVFLKFLNAEGDRARCSLSSLFTYDLGRIDPEERTNDDVFRWRNLMLGGRCISLPTTSSVLFEVHVGLSRVLNEVGNPRSPERKSSSTLANVQVDLTRFYDAFELSWGLFTKMNFLNFALGEQYDNLENGDDLLFGFGGYIEATLRAGDRFRITPGVAVSTYQDYPWALEPRVRLFWLPAGEGGSTELSAAGGLYTQTLVGAMDERDAGSAFVAWLPPLPNYLFVQDSTRLFLNKATDWGVETAGFSNGASYGDLDNDGDLDIVVNNTNMDAFVYMNQAETFTDNRFLQVVMKGEDLNTGGIGSRVTLYDNGRMYSQEVMPARGFQSSVDPVLTFGLGQVRQVDSLHIRWTSGKEQWIRTIESNQRINLNESDAVAVEPAEKAPRSVLFKDITAEFAPEIRHTENAFSDFDRQFLVPKMTSAEGPRIAVGDVNKDGLDDFFVGGAKETPGQLWIQQREGGFVSSSANTFNRDAISEDLDAAFFDADQDGDLDLFVTSGGSEFAAMAPALQDRLYLNNGAGSFSKSRGQLPSLFNSSGTVEPVDYDGDGDLDLFLGSRVSLRGYGFDAPSYILQNDGRGAFKDVTGEVAPDLQESGMVTDAAAADFTGNGRMDLVIAYEWGPVQLYENKNSRFVLVDTLQSQAGLWNRIHVTDIDQDGDLDVLAGNIGTNTKINASPDSPATFYIDDFDNNGRPDHILSMYEGEKSFPMLLKRDLIQAMPLMEQQIESHRAYASQTIEDLFSAEQIERAAFRTLHQTQSGFMINDGTGLFEFNPLPPEAQRTPIYAMHVHDFDRDGQLDITLAGNFSYVKPDFGRMYGFNGLFLKGHNEGGFNADWTHDRGFFVTGDARDMVRLRDVRFGEVILVAVNNEPVRVLQVLEK